MKMKSNLYKTLLALFCLASPLLEGACCTSRPCERYIRCCDWTGVYLGGHIGGLWAGEHWRVENRNSFFGDTIAEHHPSNFLGGGQGGYNYQFSGGILVGFEGDYSLVRAKTRGQDQLDSDATDRTRIKYLTRVTAKLGYAWDCCLIYLNGGAAWIGDRYDISLTATDALVAKAEESRVGWNVGIGGEYSCNRFLSLFLQYGYCNFGDKNNNFMQPDGTSLEIARIRENASFVKVGFNIRWNGFLCGLCS